MQTAKIFQVKNYIDALLKVSGLGTILWPPVGPVQHLGSGVAIGTKLPEALRISVAVKWSLWK
jgi:hypothetical protein